LDQAAQKHYLEYYKMGPGPLYCFYLPYHLCHFEVPNTVARAVLFGDAAVAPIARRPFVDVVATAKIDLKAGQILDGIGCFMTYGQCENSEVVHLERLLPMGLAEGCRLKRDIQKDQVITYAEVELPQARLGDKLRAEQNDYFINS
jgi:predicted homoserine dehydrogenase-like protein